MEGNSFDRITKGLAAAPSRRGLLAGVIGIAAGALTGASASEAKRNNKRNNNRRRNNGNNGQGAGTEKVQICHRTNGSKGFNLITVGRPAVEAHLAHGDFLFNGCCVAGDCAARECFSVTCAEGTCTYEVDEGASCDDFAPAAGVCNADGVCEELPIGGGGG